MVVMPCWTVISALAELYVAIDRLSILVSITRVTLTGYSVIRQISLPRAIVSCMTFLSVTVKVPTGTYTMLRSV